jgi:hypothetical protein
MTNINYADPSSALVNSKAYLSFEVFKIAFSSVAYSYVLL